MATFQDTRAVDRRNPTTCAIMSLIRRGWAGRSAFGYVAHLFAAGDFASIKAVAADTRASVAPEYALIFAALALSTIGWLGAAEVMVELVYPQVACTLDDVCMGR
jgi:hypothetical protein